MKSKVTYLPDLAEFQPDPELTRVHVSQEEVMDRINFLAKEYGELVELDAITQDCGVVCVQEDGKKVLLYPSLGMPGCEQAEQAVMDKKVGDAFTTVVAGKEITLTVKQILLNQSSEVDDSLAVKTGMEGVTTLEELKQCICKDMTEKKREELCRMLVMDMTQYLCDGATVELDEAEADSWCKEQARISYDENMSMGIDLRFTEEGDMLTEEQALEMLAEDMRNALLGMLVNQKFCEDRGFTSEKEGIEADQEYYPFVYQELMKLAEEVIA